MDTVTIPWWRWVVNYTAIMVGMVVVCYLVLVWVAWLILVDESYRNNHR